MDKYKMAILGNQDAVLGFKGLGVDAYGISDHNAKDVLKEVVECSKYAIVFITEDWVDILSNEIGEYYEMPLPAIVSVPSPKGTSGAAIKNLKRIVEQAVGSDILFKD